jgi:hypothetical protein
VAAPERVFAFLRDRGYELRHLKTCGGGPGCNEYVFEKHAPENQALDNQALENQALENQALGNHAENTGREMSP